ncbi:hypothetical protein CASFOL_018213 [Castilleja foliolosa]|uniref:AAA+ ATPase domain-containing protein n=1 Tax=Castilleja foliolosa TaxID=1961234 RepID=A0ABD3DA33_9LAMI
MALLGNNNMSQETMRAKLEALEKDIMKAKVEQLQKELLNRVNNSINPVTMEDKVDAFEKELWNISGLEGLKSQLRSWVKQLMLDERRRALGLKVGIRTPPHMAFLGNPGTGKTMVARLLGKLLHMLQIIPTEKVVEVQRTDLVGQYIGHTGLQTRVKIKEAEGGILFVDEAYRLMPANSSNNDFGLEALEEIMSFMDTGKVVVIFAGYSEQMERVIFANPGFRRRVTKFFYFDDLTCTDLANILWLKMSNLRNDQNSPLYGFKLHESCIVPRIAVIIRQGSSEKLRSDMNGGLVDVMLMNARESLDMRIDLECRDVDVLTTIMLEDLRAGLRMMEQHEEKNKKIDVECGDFGALTTIMLEDLGLSFG